MCSSSASLPVGTNKHVIVTLLCCWPLPVMPQATGKPFKAELAQFFEFDSSGKVRWRAGRWGQAQGGGAGQQVTRTLGPLLSRVARPFGHLQVACTSRLFTHAHAYLQCDVRNANQGRPIPDAS